MKIYPWWPLDDPQGSTGGHPGFIGIVSFDLLFNVTNIFTYLHILHEMDAETFWE